MCLYFMGKGRAMGSMIEYEVGYASPRRVLPSYYCFSCLATRVCIYIYDVTPPFTIYIFHDIFGNGNITCLDQPAKTTPLYQLLFFFFSDSDVAENLFFFPSLIFQLFIHLFICQSFIPANCF